MGHGEADSTLADTDSAGVYFLSVEDFEARGPVRETTTAPVARKSATRTQERTGVTGDLLGLEGRAVIVVGAGGGGIGTAISRLLVGAGAEVTGADIDADRLALAEQATRGLAGSFTPAVLDARDESSVRQLVEDADDSASLFGLVNVVGGLPIDRWAPLLDYTDESLDAVLDTNVRCALLTSRTFARRLSERGAPGSIVQIASIAALHGMPYGAAYSAAKAALISLTRTMALEWGPLGIRANVVAPGTVRSPKSQAGEDAERDRVTLPLGRRGDPEDIAGAVLYLLSDLAQWVTGQVLAVDGGASAKPSYLDESGLPVFVTDAGVRKRLLG